MNRKKRIALIKDELASAEESYKKGRYTPDEIFVLRGTAWKEIDSLLKPKRRRKKK